MGGRGVTAKEVAQIQHGKEEAHDELAPTESESLTEWFARLAAAVDVNGPKKFFFDALRAHTSRYRGDSKAKNLDAALVSAFLVNLRRAS